MKLLSAKYSNPEHTTIRAEVYLNEVITSTHIYVNIHDIHDSGNMKMIQEWEALGNSIEPFETAEETALREAKEKQDAIENAVQAHLDSKAKEKGYESILSACSYAGHTNPFQTEGQTFVTWRGEVWAYCYQVLADVQAGTRVEPTIEELIAELPALVVA